ncbi:MAG: DUF805 domain-containing protein [Elusimicrobia bacterium]|nr:DUF805 domain-containing protein [Elusimicrobiota bacterium]
MNYFKTYFTDIIFKKFFKFDGKATRKEFWLFTLNVFILELLLISLYGLAFLLFTNNKTASTNPDTTIFLLVISIIPMLLLLLVNLILIFPYVGLCIRRLRDANLSPWWILVSIIPRIGKLILLILMCLPGKQENNENDSQNTEQSKRKTTITAIIILLILFAVIVTPIMIAKHYIKKINLGGEVLISEIAKAELNYFEQNNEFLPVDRTNNNETLNINIKDRIAYNEFLCVPSIDNNIKCVEIKILQQLGKDDDARFVSMNAIQYENGELTKAKLHYEGKLDTLHN